VPDDLTFPKIPKPEYPEVENRGKLTEKQRAELILRQEGKCASCGCKPRRFEADHIEELWESGSNALHNWQALCPPCHKVKTGEAAKRRAKMNRLRGKAGQLKRLREKGPVLKSRSSFGSEYERTSRSKDQWQRPHEGYVSKLSKEYRRKIRSIRKTPERA
jgi:hypothetical protein